MGQANHSDDYRNLPRLKGPRVMAASSMLLSTIVYCVFPLSGIADQNENGMVIFGKGMSGNSAFEFKTSIRDQNIRMEFQRKDVEPVIYLLGKVWLIRSFEQKPVKSPVFWELAGWKTELIRPSLDVAKQSAFKLLPTSKVSEEISWPGLTSMLGDLKAETPALVKTGKTETIAGYFAEQYVRMNDQGSISEFWITEALQLSPNVFRAITGYTNKLARKDLHSLAERGNLELKKVQRLPDGSIWMMSEVLAIEHANLTEEIFEIPPGFKQVKKRMAENDRVSVSP